MMHEVLFVRMDDCDMGLFVNGNLIEAEWSGEWDVTPLIMREPERFFRNLSLATGDEFRFYRKQARKLLALARR